MKATAVANSNIALVKYWGKRDDKLILPQNGSISVALDGLSTTTTVEFGPHERDIFILDGRERTEEEAKRVFGQIDLIRERAGIGEKAKIVSENNFPTAAGLASSASGAAALVVAAAAAAGIGLDKKGLSVLARRGSGSACRSISGGFVEWLMGEREDGSDSYGKQIAKPEYWPDFRIITTVVSKTEKHVKSRAGMRQTVKTCPFYGCWLESIGSDLKAVRNGIAEKDIATVGSIAEMNALKMHALMWTTKPSIVYWMPETLKIIQNIVIWRKEGLDCYFTIDAGPQVKIICLKKEVKEIEAKLKECLGKVEISQHAPGGDARPINNHLF
ncbi:MAG: diphosphomevalonate decarboxylase [Candidatus Aenigmatarchaeota archaeon]